MDADHPIAIAGAAGIETTDRFIGFVNTWAAKPGQVQRANIRVSLEWMSRQTEGGNGVQS